MCGQTVSCCLSAAGVRFLGTLSCQTEFRPHYCRPTAPGAHTRTPATDPGRVYTFPTREIRTGPGALYTPGTAVLIDPRGVRGRRLPLHSGQPLPPRHSYPTRGVVLTRHQQEFPGSRPIPVFPLTCDRHGWDSGPWVFPRASHPADQEPAAHVAVGTGRAQTCSYVFDISRTSSTRLTHHVRSRVATPAHVSTPSGVPGTRPGIRPVIRQPPGGRPRSCGHRFPAVFRPPAFASWAPCPAGNSAPITLGLPPPHTPTCAPGVDPDAGLPRSTRVRPRPGRALSIPRR